MHEREAGRLAGFSPSLVRAWQAGREAAARAAARGLVRLERGALLVKREPALYYRYGRAGQSGTSERDSEKLAPGSRLAR